MKTEQARFMVATLLRVGVLAILVPALIVMAAVRGASGPPKRPRARLTPARPPPRVPVRTFLDPPGGARPSMAFPFQLEATDPKTAARAGRFTTPHGEVLTPAFMPVGTVGSVKTLTPDELRAAGADILLANTYHLYLRPGVETVRRMGGLHRFMGWPGAILTDSGGFQVMSLSELRKVTHAGWSSGRTWTAAGTC